MKKLLPLAFAAFLFGCGSPSKETTKTTDKGFDAWKEAFVERFWKMNPGYASSVGYHNYDSVLVIPDAAARKAELAFADEELKALHDFDLKALSAGNQTDYHLIENKLKAKIWAVNELKSYTWDPSEYNVCGGFAEMLNNEYGKLDTRLRDFSKRLLNVPGFYAAAKQNIKNPTLEHTQLAIDQNLGGLSVFTADLPQKLEICGLSAAEKDSLKVRSERATAAISNYADWLKNLKNDHPRDFRLGSKLYEQKFAFDIQASTSAREMYRTALIRQKDLHKRMAEICDQIWTKHMGTKPKPKNKLEMIRQVIDQLSVQHARPEEFQSTIEKQLPQLVAFVNEHNLVYIDPKKPLVVRREPDYMAGVAGASISAPGPYDKNGNTYYNVGGFNGWTAEAKESYLREYNDYILQILNIHEAIPGHYTQLVYANQSPSIIKAIFGNGTMIEGWAVYTEKMMLENGYGNDSPEMWLMYYKWNLRTVCNTILDYSVHNRGMSKEKALDLLVNQAFQQQAEAEGKWKRVTLTQVQLCSYFTGFTEICDLRRELENKEGKAFNLKKFHERFLSYGSAPVKYIRELMLAEGS